MSTVAKTIIFGTVIVAAVAIGAFFYLTRPAPPPSADGNDVLKGDSAMRLSAGSDGGKLSGAENVSVLYRVSQEESFVQFAVNEILYGEPFTAIGTTHQIAGDIELNITNPAMSRVKTMRVNARTLKTDSTQRDGAIARFILKTTEPENEFIVFTPDKISGMLSAIKTGERISFTLSGALTIREITRPVLFSGTFILSSDDTIAGMAEAIVKRSDYGLQIPSVPFVASVEDDVVLTVNIVAKRAE